MTDSHSQIYMAKALELACLGRFTVSPNPMVGCVLVKDGQVVGQGWHQRAGEAHAEVLAIRDAGEAARGATAYVTLEPCCHHGRTPPCTLALIEAGVKEVYFSCFDPNPQVAGKGRQALEAAGIPAHVGLLEKEAQLLNEIFFHFIQHRRPFVFAKWAMSLDGRTATHPEDERQISSPESSSHTHQLRQQVDAILIGARTAQQDNPQLTARVASGETPPVRQPLRIVLSSKGDLPLDLKLFDGSLPGKTLVVTTAPGECSRLKEKGVEVVQLPANPQGQVDLPALLDYLGQRQITSLLVEGGSCVHNSFFEAGLVNKIQVYLAPAVIGSLKKKQYLTQVECSALGRDFSFSVNL